MKIKNIIKRITAFMLVGITLAGSVPVNAATNDSATTDVYVTQSSSYAIRIPKQLILEGKTGIGAYRVSVKGDISGTDIITIKPDESFYMSQEGKSDILTNIDQPKTEFTYADGVRPEVEVTADGKVTMEHISAGKWSGLFNFNITSSVDVITEDSELDVEYSEISTSENNKTPISVTATGSNGENLNATSYVIEGQEKVDLLDKLAEANLINNTEEIDALIEVNSDNFEGIATTTFDVSSIANTGDEVIILHFDETKQEWEFIGQETVDENGLVTGDFTSYSPVAFVKVDKADMNLIAKVYDVSNTSSDKLFASSVYKWYKTFTLWNAEGYSGYVGYDFENPINIKRVVFDTYGARTHTLYGSNDNINWIELGNTNSSFIGVNQNDTCVIINDCNETFRYYKISQSYASEWANTKNLKFFANFENNITQ